MKTRYLSAAVLSMLSVLLAGVATAQEVHGITSNSSDTPSNCSGGAVCASGGYAASSSEWQSYHDTANRNPDGSINAECITTRRNGTKAYPSPVATAYYAARDPFHPAPYYAYGPGGIDATRTHAWNYNQAAQYPWHGGYYHRQYGQPLALVVPPTASFHTQYSWGVAQTKSLPIYHQFLRPYPGGPGGGVFAPTPYWPSNTEQFGVYPVRGPW